ncbi:hypothetical protein ABN028_33090, partial [Actinopolymorpha sp. B17G11]|uniref:hypothetical protein n=1 Tax=Actinopolymorpha sp. B17G11 TaxID=3160861 RepID=UPI0032E3FCF7
TAEQTPQAYEPSPPPAASLQTHHRTGQHDTITSSTFPDEALANTWRASAVGVPASAVYTRSVRPRSEGNSMGLEVEVEVADDRVAQFS